MIDKISSQSNFFQACRSNDETKLAGIAKANFSSSY